MKFVFTSYSSSPDYKEPAAWLKRIEGYTGILETLAKEHNVTGIERIDYEGKYEQSGVQYLFKRLGRNSRHFPRKLNDEIKQQQPDVIIINGLIFPLQVIQLRRTIGPVPKIILFHRSEKPATGLKKYLQRLADRYVDAYLFTSSEFAHSWTSHGNICSNDKIHEVMHGSSVFKRVDQTIAKKIVQTNASPVFLWVGRLDANKDPLTVIRAFQLFALQSPLARLYMIYHTEELLSEVKALIHGSESVVLVGQLTHGELENWYNATDFIIAGSHYEGGGIAVCEAMSCGCIPLVTDIVSFRGMTGYGKCGYLYEPGNVDALLALLLRTKAMDIQKEKAKVVKQFEEELSFEAIGQKIEHVVSLTINKPR